MLLHFATRRTRARSSVPEALVAATSKHQSQGKLDLARVIGPGNSAKAAAGDSGRQIVKARMVKHVEELRPELVAELLRDRKSTRLNSSHRCISYAVFCLKKKIHEVHSQQQVQ